jgi:hypothetical protein
LVSNVIDILGFPVRINFADSEYVVMPAAVFQKIDLSELARNAPEMVERLRHLRQTHQSISFIVAHLSDLAVS